MSSNSRSFWERFAAIGGMFAVLDYYHQVGSLEEILQKGPQVLQPFFEGEGGK